MRLKKTMAALALGAALTVSPSAWAAHPLITDDAGTQGKGKFQFEVNGECDSDKDAGIKTTGGQVAASLSYGMVENADLVFGLPYAWYSVSDGGPSASGISDASIEVKWRFYEKNGLSFGLKPGITLPTGDEDKGLGTGKTGYHVFLIGSKEAAPWAFHANAGYIRNENKTDEEENLWHVSVATTYNVAKDMKLVGNVGIEKNPDRNADTDPAFLIFGGIYSPRENFDLDLGVKYGLTSSETDYSLLAGTTFRF